MRAIHCQIHYHSTSSHLQQLHAGLLSLARQGVVSLSQRRRDAPVRYGDEALSAAAGHAHLDVVVDGAIRLHFDTHDACDVAVGELDGSDLYFKRSLSPACAAHLGAVRAAKLRPLGLNYRVLPDGLDWPGARRALGRLDPAGSASRLARLGEALDAFDLLGFRPRLSRMHAPPQPGAEPRVLFLVAAYDPHDDPSRDPVKAQDREAVNELRAACIRALRRALGPRFLGGFAASSYARRRYPGLLAGVATSQEPFLRTLREYPIGVATTGLHGSTGWKLAEYVAFSKAIVSEPPLFPVPGEFRAGRNYSAFAGAEDCAAAAVRLVEDQALREAQMHANADYYRQHLRPDRLVLGALEVALGHAGRPLPAAFAAAAAR